MALLSAVVPSFTLEGDLTENLTKMLNVSNKSEINYFKLVPISEHEVQKLASQNAEIGFRIESYSGMNMRKILGYMEENKQLKIQVKRLKETLMSVTDAYKNMNKSPVFTNDFESEKAKSRKKQIRSLDDENAKLKHLLKGHLEQHKKLKSSTVDAFGQMRKDFEEINDSFKGGEKMFTDSPLGKKLHKLAYRDADD